MQSLGHAESYTFIRSTYTCYTYRKKAPFIRCLDFFAIFFFSEFDGSVRCAAVCGMRECGTERDHHHI